MVSSYEIKRLIRDYWCLKTPISMYVTTPVADPGSPVGGRGPRRGAWTPEVAMFRKICMSK